MAGRSLRSRRRPIHLWNLDGRPCSARKALGDDDSDRFGQNPERVAPAVTAEDFHDTTPHLNQPGAYIVRSDDRTRAIA